MQIVTLDFESFWDTGYSLSKMSPLEYVMGDQFEAISVSIKLDEAETQVYFGTDVKHALREIPWSKSAALGHNMSGFDSYILAYRYGIKPRMWMCTAAMARPLHAKTCGVSLAKLVQHYGLGVKDNAVLMNTKGRHLKDFTAEEIEAMRVYNKADTDQCYALFKKLKPYYNAQELWQIDALTRMRTEPQFELDVGLLKIAASVERTRKHKALLDLAKTLGITDIDWTDENNVVEHVRSELASAPKFAALLERLGVEVPMKTSPTNPENQIPALSKTDDEFVALQDHPDELVAAAARARLDVKSTLLETRIEKFMTAGRLAGGRLPIPIRYCGADTTGRDSGEEYNPQNLPRVSKKAPKPSDALRMSLGAPKGKKVIVADQSGIELRVNHYLWQVELTMAVYADNPAADLYRASGAAALGIKPEELTAEQRQMEKVKNLGLGFGAGGATFQRIAKTMGGMTIDIDTAKRHTLDWRQRHDRIVDGWKQCEIALRCAYNGQEVQVDQWGLVHTVQDGFRLPSGRLIHYPDLHTEDDGEWPNGRKKKSWWYGQGRSRARITGPKACENIVQALARDSIFDCAVEFYRQTGLRPALRVHDELVYVVDDRQADELLGVLQGIMRTPPKWWPQLVVWSEGGVGDTYATAK